MNYTDLHCDTAYEIYKSKSGLKKNNHHIDMAKAGKYDRYSQIFAVWSDNDKTDDENYADFFEIRGYFIENLAEFVQDYFSRLPEQGTNQSIHKIIIINLY